MKIKDIKDILKSETSTVDIPMSRALSDTPIPTGETTVKRPSFWRWLLPVFSCMCCVLLCLSIVFKPQDEAQLTSYILSINPSICITTNQSDEVVGICSLNADGDDILDNSEFDDIIGSDFSTCVNKIIYAVDESVFANYGSNTIHLYAINDNKTIMDTKLNAFGEIVRESLDNRGYGNISFDKSDMALDFFRQKMGFQGDFDSLDDMQRDIERHDRFFDNNHIPPPQNNPIANT